MEYLCVNPLGDFEIWEVNETDYGNLKAMICIECSNEPFVCAIGTCLPMNFELWGREVIEKWVESKRR